MLRRVRTKLSYANVMATIALMIALGGTGYAATRGIPDSSGVFHGCVAKKTGALRVVTPGSRCKGGKKGEFAVSWNQRVKPGRLGPVGRRAVRLAAISRGIIRTRRLQAAP